MPARGRIAAAAAASVIAANAIAVSAVWWASGGPDDVRDTGTALIAAGRVAGLLGAYLVLVELVLLARLPVLDRLVGFDRLAAWHRTLGFACVAMLLGHAALVTGGNAAADGLSPPAALSRLISGYPGVITALAALVLLVAVAVTSALAVRRRMRYQTWYFVHLTPTSRSRSPSAMSSRTGTDFVGNPVARTYWTALRRHAGGILVFRPLPIGAARGHRLRVARVVEEGRGVTSIEIDGVALERLGARSGQSSLALPTRDRWWEAHPFSLSAAPDGRRLRITVKGLGDYSARMARSRPARA